MDKPTILFVAFIDDEYTPFRADKYGLGKLYSLLPHKYGVLALIGWLRENGCDGHYLWVSNNREEGISEIREAISRYKPHAIGFSLCTDEIISHYKIIESLKEKHPDLPVIVGGPHVSALPEHTLKHYPLIDYIAIGEGEKTLTEWLHKIAAGQGKSRMREIKGLGYHDVSGKAGKIGRIVINAPREKIKDIDILPDPAYDLICEPDPVANRGIFLPIITSYGCPFYCTFCAADHGNHRYISAVKAVDRIERARTELLFDHFVLCDSFWPPSDEWVDEFCNEVENRGLKIKFQFETRAGTLSEKQFRRLKRIGATVVAIGVESGDQDILRSIKKGITPDMARKTIAALHKVGIFSRAFFMFGNQGETHETARTTIEFMRELNPSLVAISTFRPFPGTEAWKLLPEEDREWWMVTNDRGKWWERGKIPSICNLSSDELAFIAGEAGLRYPVRWSYLQRHFHGGRLPMEFRRFALRIFMLHLRKYILGISERYPVFRPIIQTAKAIFRH